MDGVSTAIIVLLFAATIFGSLGSNKGYTPPSVPESKIPAAVVVQQSSVNPKYFAVVGQNVRPSIQKYIANYRNPDEAAAITDSIMRHSQAYQVNPKLVTALIARESRFNPKAVSSSGALGLGQLMPATCKSTGVTEPFDIDQNVKGTVRYMKYLLGRFEKYADQVSFSVAGYLEGPNAVARNKGYKPHTASYVSDILKIYHKL
ncbi:MAG: lytic transglycosylase domain-containing protein [Candidatus Saganbacteria bacterium]|nr:lytic transglycosylase domain-containing protein [Candidatus Saganbacteria bacterium]